MLKTIFHNERELRAGWRFLLYCIMVGSLIAGLRLAVHLLTHGPAGMGNGELRALSVILSDSVGFLFFVLPALVMARFEKRTLGDYGLPARGAFGARLWEGILWGFGLQAATIGILIAAGNCQVSGFAVSGAAALKYGALWAVAFLLVGFTEEFSFRGYSQFTLTTGMGFWPAAIVLSGGFAGIHLFNPGENWVGAVGVFLASMVLVLPLRRTGALWFSIGLHAGWDWTETYFFGVRDSGLQAHGFLLNTSFQGSKWMTGGTVGPEASVVALAILALAILLLHMRFPKAEYPRAGALKSAPPVAVSEPAAVVTPAVP